MRGKEFDDLRDLDDGGAGDRSDPESFGDGELQALCGSEVDVEDEVFVAVGADEGDTEVADGGGDGVSEGLEGAAEGVHCCEMRGRLASGMSLGTRIEPQRSEKMDRVRQPYGAKTGITTCT